MAEENDNGGTGKTTDAKQKKRASAAAERERKAAEESAAAEAAKNAEADANADDGTPSDGAEAVSEGERQSARARLGDQIRMAATLAGLVAKNGAVKTTKAAMPLMHGYVGTEAVKRTDENGNVIEEPNRLTEEEKTTLKAAGEKFAFESIELASLAYPTVDGIEPYRAVRGENGLYPAPHLGQLLSLGAVVERFFGDRDNLQDDPNLPGNGPEGDPVAFLETKEPVLMTALTADDYGYLNMPVQPRTIRRFAFNQREMMLMNQEPAMQSRTMAQTSATAPSTGSYAMSNNQISSNNQAYVVSAINMTRGGPAMVTSGPMAAASAQTCSGCGCATQAAQPVSAARYNPDGTCMDTMCISCETKWRMRNCLKLALCEFISCIADEFCVDGRFQKPNKDIGEILLCCLGDAMCTTLHCLPEAICGPRQEESCVPPPALECNFAVEEKR